MAIASLTLLPSTVNFHINWHCNADCVFCYRPSGAELTTRERCELLQQLAAMPLPDSTQGKRRINFAGGEPSLVKSLPMLLEHSRTLGFSTSLITNASVYLKKSTKLHEVIDKLDMMGVSIDSVDEHTNRKIQRPHFSVNRWLGFAQTVQSHGVYFKINTTVCHFNASKNLASFVSKLSPDRWKILRAIPVGGTVGTSQYRAKDWITSDLEFESFVARHAHVEPAPIVENDSDLRGSYAMISPDGCFYDSTRGFYTKSDPILDVGVEEAFRQVNFSHRKFRGRGGVYSIPVVTA